MVDARRSKPLGSSPALLSKYLEEGFNFLDNINPDEVSIVTAGMNQQWFGIRKEAPVAFDFNELIKNTVVTNPQFATVTKEMTPDTKQASEVLCKVRSAFADSLTDAQVLDVLGIKAPAAPAPVTAPVTKEQDPEVARIEKEWAAKTEKLEKELAVEKDARLNKEYVEKAGDYFKGNGSVPTFSPKTLGPVLRDVDEHLTKENAEALRKHFASCGAITSEITKIRGRAVEKEGDNGPDGTIEHLAKELASKNDGMTIEQARVAIYRSRPDLVDEIANRE